LKVAARRGDAVQRARKGVVMLRIVLIGLLAVVVVLLVVIALQPAAFRIERSATMAAPPAAVFAQVNDFHNWEAWNPWQKVDPTARNTYSGAAAGPGSTFAWQGNKDVGEGRMTILESRPNELVKIKLEFLKPFAATNTADFTFVPSGGQTRVTWAMSGENGFMGKAIGLVMNMDQMVGGQFEKGLADLKSIVEARG
jgi:carbon monoxide dehydrogenase subunit G